MSPENFLVQPYRTAWVNIRRVRSCWPGAMSPWLSVTSPNVFAARLLATSVEEVQSARRRLRGITRMRSETPLWNRGRNDTSRPHSRKARHAQDSGHAPPGPPAGRCEASSRTRVGVGIIARLIHACTAPGFLDSGLTVFASTPPRPARGGRVAPGPGFGSRTSPASTARCTSA